MAHITAPSRSDRTRTALISALGPLLTLVAFASGTSVSASASGPRTDVGWIDAERKKVQPIDVPLLVDNAFDTYRQAVSAASEPCEPDDVAEGWTAAVVTRAQPVVVAGLPAIRDLVTRNAAVLEKVHEAAGKDYMSPTEPDITTTYPWLAKDRFLARLVTAAAYLAHLDGDDALALQRIEDSYALGVNVPRGGVLIEELVGVAIIAIAARPSTFVILDGQAPTDVLKTHALRMRELRARMWPLSLTLTREWEVTRTGLDLLEREGINALTGTAEPGAAPGDAAAGPKAGGGATEADPGGTMEWLEDRFARFIEAAAKPFGDTSFDELAARSEQDALDRGEDVAATLMPVIGKVRTKWLEAWAKLMADETIACLEAYRREKGRYPESLGALVPGYMPELPVDPWTGGSLLYRAEGDGFTLYAVGPDRKDDGGQCRQASEPDQVFVPVRTAP